MNKYTGVGQKLTPKKQKRGEMSDVVAPYH
jgi:hypothetical protein